MKLQRIIIGLLIGLGVIGGYFFGASLARESMEVEPVSERVEVLELPESSLDTLSQPMVPEVESGGVMDFGYEEVDFEEAATSAEGEVVGDTVETEEGLQSM